jgi:eukaryotic-like serine/threonine-protein kinase
LLPAGSRIGPYEVMAPLGAGGMGEVYRARDPRLGRDVALKVVAPDAAADPERLGRFEREARAVAALDHPHILAVHDIGSDRGVDYVVFELLEGQTLRRRLESGPLPARKVVDYGVQVCRGLAAAHEHGVVHRDLKPENLFLTAGGQVKILDFGLAKQTGPADDENELPRAETRSAITEAGRVMGTAGYMSPEQAQGQRTDARSDVFALGAILYEMLSGRRAFAGSTPVDTLAAVLRADPPDIEADGVPPGLERVVRRCLEKDPGERFQSAHDVGLALETLSGPAPPSLHSKRRRRIAVRVLAAVGVLAAAAAAVAWYLKRTEIPAPQVVLVASSRVTGDQVSFSPDGNQVAFSSPGERGDNWDIWLKIVGEAETHRLTHGPAAHYWPAWSPDGNLIAFTRYEGEAPVGAVYLVSPLGGQERRLSDLPVGFGLSWSPDGHWLAVTNARAEGDTTPGSGGIHLIPAGGGEPHPVTFPKPPYADYYPAFSPNGRALAFFSCLQFRARCDLHVLSLDPEFRPAGAPRRLPPQKVDAYGLAWTRDGKTILYGVVGDRLWRVRADGTSPPESVELAGRRAYGPFTLASRDRLGFIRDAADSDIYQLKMGSTAATPLIASTAPELDPQYSPDGQRIAFTALRDGDVWAVWLAEADGSNPTRLTRGPGRQQLTPRWSPDGRTIAFEAQAEDGHWDVWTMGVEGAGLRQITHRDGDDGPSWSRDGRWLYFTSDRTGRDEIWRVAVTGGAEEQFTREGGARPFESSDGRTLFYKRARSDAPASRGSWGGGAALLARPTAGGPERTAVQCVPEPAYAVGPEGVFHLDCVRVHTAPPRRSLRYWNARTGEDRLVTTLDVGVIYDTCLSVSPDGQTVLFTRDTRVDDLMMIENFR